MRRKTSAWTTTIIGGLITASVVSAQQSTAPKDGSGSRSTAQESDPASIYGASANRGARYLLRNGLDYLSYQQYERALKFLRDAEAKQKELNAAEKLALKQGIEKAQRGLREAADAETPYALSDRTRHKGGFRAAKPETEIAAGAEKGSSKKGVSRASKRVDSPASGDEQGEPIQLASGETTDGPAASTAAPAPVQAQVGAPAPLASTQPRALPEIPKLPLVESMPALEPEPTAPVAPTRTNEDRLALAGAEVSEPPAPFDPPKMTSPSAAEAPPATALSPTLTPSSVSGPIPSSRGMQQPTSPGPAVIELETIPSPAAANPPAVQPTAPQTATAVQEPTAAAIEPPPSTAPVEPTPMPAASQLQPAPSQAPAPSQPAAEPAMDLPPLPATEQPQPTPNPATPPIQETAPSPPATRTQPAEPSQPVAEPALELPPLPAANQPAESTAVAATGQPPPVVETPAPVATPAPTASDTAPSAEELPLLPQGLGAAPMPSPSPAPAAPPATSAAPDPTADEALPKLPDAPPVQASTPVALAMNAAPATLPQQAAPEPTTGAQTAPAAQPEPVQTTLPALPEAAANTSEPPAPPAGPARRGTRAMTEASDVEELLPRRPPPPSTLKPELRREVEKIARKQEDLLQQRGLDRVPTDAVDSQPDLRIQSQIDISRAPSPAEARPIKAIPVPEDWVPLAPRTWSPQSKYWAAAATCHLPLYFQDPVLERYGHSVEQFVGPIGRFLTYPVDDPTQSTQRNQILQPAFSVGLMALQIIAGPYNLIMDPPWEAQYDLGYYRPGDDIPTDLYWLPLHGYGPPLRGNRY